MQDNEKQFLINEIQRTYDQGHLDGYKEGRADGFIAGRIFAIREVRENIEDYKVTDRFVSLEDFLLDQLSTSPKLN